MKFVQAGAVCVGLAVVLAGNARPQSARAAGALTANEVVARAVSRADDAQARTGPSGYSYTKVSVTEELDATGKLKQRKEKVYQISFHDGSTYARLLEVNGRAPAEADLKKQAENETNVRQLLGGSKSGRTENRDYFLTPELVARYRFTLSGQTQVNGRAAYEIRFEPKTPGPPERRMVDRLLDRISGTLWIDAQEFEVARAQIQLRSEVDLLGGVIGCLRKMAYTMTRTRVANGLWLNTDSIGDFEGRKLLDFLRIKTKSQCLNFRPLA